MQKLVKMAKLRTDGKHEKTRKISHHSAKTSTLKPGIKKSHKRRNLKKAI